MRTLALYGLGILIAHTAMAEPPRFTVQDIGTLGGRFTTATGVNEAGQVTGYSETADGQIHGFVYANGQMQDLGTLGGTGSLGAAINALGAVTGFALNTTSEEHTFIDAAGLMTDLGTAGTSSTGK